MHNTAKEALAINKENKNTLWQDAIERERENINIAFKIIPEGEKGPNGYQVVNCHMVFDI